MSFGAQSEDAAVSESATCRFVLHPFLADQDITMLHVVHVVGTRMIGQGSDGLSRGNFSEGVMMGRSMMSYYVPLSRSALE